jgi:hypothetical protein
MQIEKDSPAVPLLIIACTLLILIGGGVGLAFLGGVFTGKNAVIANDRRILDQAAKLHPTEVSGTTQSTQDAPRANTPGTLSYSVVQDSSNQEASHGPASDAAGR